MTPIAVDIVSDFICPWCYVGLKSFRAATGDGDRFRARLRPYDLDPTLPDDGADRARRMAEKFPDPSVLAAIRARLVEAAGAAGFSFDPARPQRVPRTLKAHLLVQAAAAQGRAVEVATALFAAYWDEGADLADRATLIAIAGEAGLDLSPVEAALGDGAALAAVRAEAEMFRRAGVSGVPTFIVAERVGFSGALPPSELLRALERAAEQAAR